ncbi:NAD(P)H-binding protein [Kribbella italica]
MGKTGRRVVERLEQRDVPVRLASRSSEQRFDWYDEGTWTGAAAGVDTAYLAPPVGPTGLTQAGRFVKQAAAEGLRRVVLLSGRGVGSPEREFAVYESSVELENAVKESGAEWTIVRPAWFMQGFSEDFLLDYVLAGEVRVSAGTGGEAWIDTNDVGDVMAAAILDDSHSGQHYTLSGPRVLTIAEVTAELSAATGRDIRYVDLDPEQHVEELVGIGLPHEDAESVRDLFAVIRHHRSEYVSDDAVRAILGRAPRDFSDWARETAATGVWSA